MTLPERLVAIIAPHECVGCGCQGRLLCNLCIPDLVRPPSRCYRCRKVTQHYKTCPSCRSTSPLTAVYPATSYKDQAETLVKQLKFGSARAGADDIARALQVLDSGVVVPVMTASSRARRRGYDQAVLIARTYAKLAQLPYAPHLVRQGQTQQVGATRDQRRKQLEGAFRVKGSVVRKRLILIDDVLTTGATLEAAARTLKAAGAKSVIALVFAQV